MTRDNGSGVAGALAGQWVRIGSVPIGSKILIFGSVVEVLSVEAYPPLPYARLVRIRPVGREATVTALVPADVRPLLIRTDRSRAGE